MDIYIIPGRKFGTNIHRQLQFNYVKSGMGFWFCAANLFVAMEGRKRSGEKTFVINVVMSYYKGSQIPFRLKINHGSVYRYFFFFKIKKKYF